MIQRRCIGEAYTNARIRNARSAVFAAAMSEVLRKHKKNYLFFSVAINIDDQFNLWYYVQLRFRIAFQDR